MREVKLPSPWPVARGAEWSVNRFAREVVLIRPNFRSDLASVQISIDLAAKFEKAEAGRATVCHLTDAEHELFVREARHTETMILPDILPVMNVYLYAFMTAKTVADPEKPSPEKTPQS